MRLPLLQRRPLSHLPPVSLLRRPNTSLKLRLCQTLQWLLLLLLLRLPSRTSRCRRRRRLQCRSRLRLRHRPMLRFQLLHLHPRRLPQSMRQLQA